MVGSARFERAASRSRSEHASKLRYDPLLRRVGTGRAVSAATVPTEGLEPPRPFGHRCLKPARLPVPPGRHGPGRRAAPAPGLMVCCPPGWRPAVCSLCSFQCSAMVLVPDGDSNAKITGFEPAALPWGFGPSSVAVQARHCRRTTSDRNEDLGDRSDRWKLSRAAGLIRVAARQTFVARRAKAGPEDRRSCAAHKL